MRRNCLKTRASLVLFVTEKIVQLCDKHYAATVLFILIVHFHYTVFIVLQCVVTVSNPRVGV